MRYANFRRLNLIMGLCALAWIAALLYMLASRIP